MKKLNKKNALIGFICIIGCIISIGVISIFTIFQAKADENNNTFLIQQFSYSGFDNEAGTLEILNFTKSGDQSNTISSFFMENDTIVLEPNVIVGNTNSGNILGGHRNTTESTNNNIIGGQNNTIKGDGIILGGESNYISGNNNTIIGGEENKITGSNNSIIGGKSNTISENAQNIIILGGENNSVSQGNNIIVAGENVTISDQNFSDSFVFNNDSSSFSPSIDGTFYINSKDGLGLNGEGGSNGKTIVNGGIYIGELDIDDGCSNSEDIGIIGKANDCLLACTENSLNIGRSLLENSQRCVDRCRENLRCIEPPVIPEIEHETFPAYCTGNIFPSSTPCFSQFHPEKYKDVVFVYNYVNKCPNNQEDLDNPCTYKCPEGYSFGEGTCKKNCTVTGNNGEEIVIHHGESLVLYLQENPTCPARCLSTNRQCNNGNFEGGMNALYTHLTCQIQEGLQCDENEYNIEENQKVVGGKYQACTGYTINGNSCTRHVKYKLQECDTGYTLSGGVCHKDCSFNGISVHYGETITGYKYQSSNCKDEYLCNISKILKCGEEGSFGPNAQDYPYTGCNLIGENCSGYNLTSCPNHGICSSCTGYTLNQNKCNQFIKYKLDSCNTGYSKDGDTCKSDCNLPRGGSIPHSRTAVGYKNNSQTCPSGCEDSSNKKTMTCNDGYLEGSGTYIYSGCTTQISSGQGFNRLSKVENAECESIISYDTQNNICIAGVTKYKCTKCKNGYTWNGEDWNGDGVKCLKDCSFTALPSNTTIYLSGNGGSIITYSTGHFICPDFYSNYSQTRTCNDGYLDGSFQYTNFDQEGISCSNDQTPGIRTFYNQQNEATGNLILTKFCTNYDNNNCQKGDTLYSYKCKDGYNRADNGSKCIRCEGNIPSNAHANNSTPNGNESINYHYSENIGESCSYSCNDGFSRNGNQCVSNDKKCHLDGNTYIEGAFATLYENNKFTCYNTCKEIRVECKKHESFDSLQRRDYENYRRILGDDYTKSCRTVPGYVKSTNGNLIEGTCEENFHANGQNNKIFTGINQIANAFLTEVCVQYMHNGGTGCNTPVTYRKFNCKNGWSGDTCPSVCTHNGIDYENGSEITMYNKGGLQKCPVTISSETRTCKNGTRYSGNQINDFSAEFIYTGYSLTGGCPNDYSRDIPERNQYDTQSGYFVTPDTTCEPAYNCYKASDNCLSGYSMVNGVCQLNCNVLLFENNTSRNRVMKTIKHGDSITVYSGYFSTCPNTCNPKILTCSGGNLNGDTTITYKYSNCITVPNSCSSSEYPYTDTSVTPEGSLIGTCTGYIFSNNNCNTNLRYKVTGCKTGYTYTGGDCKPDCNFYGQTIKYGSSVTGYVSTECPGPCQQQRLTCDDNWSSKINANIQSSCVLKPKQCTTNYNLGSCPEGGECYSCTGYTTQNNSCKQTIKYQFHKCKDHYTPIRTSTGTICQKNCISDEFGEIAHEGKVTAWKFENGQCYSTERTCNNGILTGDTSFSRVNCVTCTTPRNTKVDIGTRITGYKLGRCTSNNSECDSTQRICKNDNGIGKRYSGSIQKDFGEYTNQKCIMINGESSSCTSEYIYTQTNQIQGGIFTGGCFKYVYNGNQCVGTNYYKLIGCENNYTLIGNTCHKGCSVWNKSYPHGTTVTGYTSSSVQCSINQKECKSETRTCIDGKRYDGGNEKDFSGLYEGCNLQANPCQGYTLNQQPTNPNCEYQTCQTYTVENGSCKEGNQKYVLIDHVTNGYYATGSTCNSICGDGITNPCNRPYTATGALRDLTNSNIRVNLRGNSYTCNKKDNSVFGLNTQQCNCPGGSIWNGSVCGDIPSSLCKEGAGNYFKCNNSYAVDQLDDISGYTWKCKNAKNTESCHLCKSGYEWNEQTASCVSTCKDYPLTKCPYGGNCSRCPSNTSKLRLDSCKTDSLENYGPMNDERGVTYWISTTDFQKNCPLNGVCGPMNLVLSYKNNNGIECVANGYRQKITSCQPCYRKAYGGPECVRDENYCNISSGCHINPDNQFNGSLCSDVYGGETALENYCNTITTADLCAKVGAISPNIKTTLTSGSSYSCCSWVPRDLKKEN